MRGAALLALVVALGCRKHHARRVVHHDAGVARWIGEDAAPRESDDEAFVRGVPFDCSGAPPVACTDTPTPLAELEHAAHRFVDGMHHGPDEDSIAMAEKAIGALDPTWLSTEERVVAQSIALRIAFKVLPTHRELSRSAHDLAERLALDAHVLERLGSEPAPELDVLIGPRAAWREKKPVFIPFLHEQLFLRTMAFRAVQYGELRAVFGQFIAIDREHKPHITPFIGELELRRGTHLSAPACALIHDARCGAPARLRAPRTMSDLPRAPFFMEKPEGRVACTTCHSKGSTFTLAFLEGSVRDHLAERRKTLFEQLERNLALLP